MLNFKNTWIMYNDQNNQNFPEINPNIYLRQCLEPPQPSNRPIWKSDNTTPTPNEIILFNMKINAFESIMKWPHYKAKILIYDKDYFFVLISTIVYL